MAHSPPIFFHLKLVAKVSLAVGALAALVLLAVLTLITGAASSPTSRLTLATSLRWKKIGGLCDPGFMAPACARAAPA